MSTIVTRSGKGSPLTHAEVDDNFTNLNTDKYQEGSAIGALTPAAGTFTTLTATGQTSLGGAAGSEGLRVGTVSSSVNFWYAQGSVTGGGVQFRPSGGDTNIPALFSSKGNSQQSFYTNTFAQEQFRVSHTASAVNYVQLTGAATGGRPTISAQGSDTNIDLNLTTKGTGSVNLNTGNGTAFKAVDLGSTAVNWIAARGSGVGGATILYSGGTDTDINTIFGTKGAGLFRFSTARDNGGNLGADQMRVAHTASAVNYVQVTGAATGGRPTISSQGSDTNIDLTLTPKGTGATVANGDFKMNSGYGSAAVAYGCRAWVNFNGTGAVAIRASGNVSSITDNGTGDYTVNFTNAMPDANYSVSGCCRPNAGQVGLIYEQPDSPIRSTTQLRIFEVSNNLLFDSSFVSVVFFR